VNLPYCCVQKSKPGFGKKRKTFFDEINETIGLGTEI